MLEKHKDTIYKIGVICAIISLIMFMFTSTTWWFHIVTGFGCIVVLYIYDDYEELMREKKHIIPPSDLDKKE